jgi:hypothetical protein
MTRIKQFHILIGLAIAISFSLLFAIWNLHRRDVAENRRLQQQAAANGYRAFGEGKRILDAPADYGESWKTGWKRAEGDEQQRQSQRDRDAELWISRQQKQPTLQTATKQDSRQAVREAAEAELARVGFYNSNEYREWLKDWESILRDQKASRDLEERKVYSVVTSILAKKSRQLKYKTISGFLLRNGIATELDWHDLCGAAP